VRIPLPLRPDVIVGSIYDNQSILENRFYRNLDKEKQAILAE
jgi:hypothetical protein